MTRRSARGAGRAVVALVSALVLLSVLAGATATPVRAQEVITTGTSTLEERTRAVASQLRCPVCQGNSIQDSPSELAQEMKGVVRDQLAAGKRPDEVIQYFVDKYGEWILLEPKPTGFNLIAYLLPVVGLIGGGFVIWRAVRKWTAPPPPDEATPAQSHG